jgi:hypothetical protein
VFKPGDIIHITGFKREITNKSNEGKNNQRRDGAKPKGKQGYECSDKDVAVYADNNFFALFFQPKKSWPKLLNNLRDKRVGVHALKKF